MTNLKRKIRRSKTADVSRENQVDKFNEEKVKAALENEGETHIESLHPTKGYRQVSKKRLNYTGPSGYLWSISKAMMDKCVIKDESSTTLE